ncbi:hypothetical protein HDV03_000878 [Kappamyces sp. JEL0829]|nr:hypothetical protein HDV03_000878 [Kappamyces sp. JEL0829]
MSKAATKPKSANLLANWIKKFLSLYGIKTALSLLGWARKGRPSLLHCCFDASNARFALAYSSYSFLFHALKPRAAKMVGQEKPAVVLSGSLASLCLLIDRDDSRSEAISQLVFIRTLYFAVRAWLYASGDADMALEAKSLHDREPHLKLRASSSTWTKWMRTFIHRHGLYATWSFVAWVICYRCFVKPDHVTKEFFNALITVTSFKKRTGKEADQIVRGMARLSQFFVSQPSRDPIELIPPTATSIGHIESVMQSGTALQKQALAPSSKIVAVLDPDIRHSRLMCAIQHPETASCFGGGLVAAGAVFMGIWKTYLIINSVSFLFSEATMLYKAKLSRNRRPRKSSFANHVRKTMVATVRNSLMISAFVGLFSFWTCVIRRAVGRETLFQYGLAGTLACPSIFIDKPGRLVELNAYSGAKVLESYLISLKLMGIVNYTRFTEQLVMVPTYGLLAWVMEYHPEALNGFAVPVFQWLYRN